ncbi:MAG: hypothetical protein NVS1B12_15820 [Acidimicrobiales bacterium]
MESDDELDDDGSSGPLLPPDDRLWRHPSELTCGADGAPTLASAPPGPSRMWTVALLAGAIGAILTAGVGYAAGGLRTHTVAVPAVESNVLSPVVTLASAAPSGFVTGSQRVRSSVVVLVAHDAHGIRVSDGVIVRSDGMLLTCAHTVLGAQSLTATVGGARRVGAKIVASDPASDIALVKLDGRGYDAAPLGSALDLRLGDPVMVLHPAGDTTAGDVPGEQASVDGMGREVAGPTSELTDLLEVGTAAPVSTLGGPLLDRRGAVIAIAGACGTAGRAVEYATPIDLARAVEQQLLENRRVVPVWLGVEGSDLSAEAAKAIGVIGGATVSRVAPASPAQLAGMRAGDVVVGLDGRVVASMANLIMALHARPPGTQVELAVRRDGQSVTVLAHLAPRPAGT